MANSMPMLKVIRNFFHIGKRSLKRESHKISSGQVEPVIQSYGSDIRYEHKQICSEKKILKIAIQMMTLRSNFDESAAFGGSNKLYRAKIHSVILEILIIEILTP